MKPSKKLDIKTPKTPKTPTHIKDAEQARFGVFVVVIRLCVVGRCEVLDVATLADVSTPRRWITVSLFISTVQPCFYLSLIGGILRVVRSNVRCVVFRHVIR